MPFIANLFRSWSRVAILLSFCAAIALHAETYTDEDIAALDKILATVKPGQTEVAVGDMVFDPAVIRAWRDRMAASRAKSGVVAESSTTSGLVKWTGGNVYYTFDGSVSGPHQTKFKDAAAEWALFANVHFLPRISEANYIIVKDSGPTGGNNSYVGMKTSGPQDLNISSTGWERGTLCHEIGHALGLIHEHQRSDRDTYVTINTGNILNYGSGNEGNFDKLATTNNSLPYDYLSVMHYARNTFSNNYPTANTIVPKINTSTYLDIIGTSPDRILSRSDRAGIAALYGAGPTLSSVVTNTSDAGVGSLRAAIYYAWDYNLDHPGATTTITFHIPTPDAAGVFTIQPTDRLPAPGINTIIDGATQTAFTGNTNPSGPEIVINGALAAPDNSAAFGFRLSESGVSIKSLTINGFPAQGVWFASTASNIATSTNNTVSNCYLGTNATGTAGTANGYGAKFSDNAHGNTLGNGNLISGNTYDGVLLDKSGTTGNIVAGNYIGLNAAGTASIANSRAGVDINGGATNNTIGGANSAARNVISGNAQYGIEIIGAGTNGNIVAGNYIGLAANGTTAVPNSTSGGYGGVGIFGSASGNTIGGTSGGRNYISGNGAYGVLITANATSNVVAGNTIGLNFFGGTVANSWSGVGIFGGAQSNTIGGTLAGASNIISGNGNYGVALFEPGTINNRISRNSIYSNAFGSILLSGTLPNNDVDDVDSGPNNLQNFPVLNSAALGTATVVAGSLNSTAGTAFTIEFFATGSPSTADAKTFLGSTVVTTTGTNATFNYALTSLVPAGQKIVAIAIDPNGNTSQCSGPITVSTTTDSDSDGMPDSYEGAYGNLIPAADNDGDGMSNLSEFYAGTTPTNAADRFYFSSVTNSSGINLTLSTKANHVYRIDYTDDLASPTQWHPLVDQVLATGTSINLTDPGAGATRRFYRGVVLP